MVVVKRDTPPRGRLLWLEAGQELLRSGGIGAVKLHALAAALGLTTGSFYHHFGSMAEYLDELARHYGTDKPESVLAAAEHPDPRRRLVRLRSLSLDERMAPLDRAMREWAATNEIAASAVRDADGLILRFIERAFRDLGHTGREAQLRALLLVSAGVARVIPPWPARSRDYDRIVDILAG